ncbi:RNA-binding cell elongation regulator Jag/EloR [Anaerosphaera multitolerans]|uniref:RNA-binding protein KhpB n=1 Tax=Anaerosphaera multitolerans TaxID=2487351 RepID=A0A437SA99_9FIRM|nr:RNA-binding cell elongation regulator Jag/EloR [Anaerosphaera multitolerans]RVU55747.1 protein jag [Anaerosphaera multitolerans]
MNYVIKTAKTVDEAVSEALTELNIKREDAKVEVIEEPSKGFLGIIGSKQATVKVSKVEDTKDILKEIFSEDPEKSQRKPETDEFENKSLVDEDPVEEVQKEVVSDKTEEDITREFMDKLMESLGVDYDLEIERKDNILNINILGDEQKLGIVIGKRGATLDSIQYILSLIINKNSEEYVRVIVDSSGYRNKREQTLRELAKKMAAKVLRTNRSIRLEPMSAQERKIIHETLQDYEGVITHSEGKEPYRKIVIQKERKY